MQVMTTNKWIKADYEKLHSSILFHEIEKKKRRHEQVLTLTNNKAGF